MIQEYRMKNKTCCFILSIFLMFWQLSLNGADSVGIKDKYTFDLGPFFQDWKVLNSHLLEDGYSLTCHVPPSYTKESYVMECLEVTMIPSLRKIGIDRFFEMEKSFIQNKTTEKVQFQVFKKSPTQIVYSYSIPRDGLRLNAIVKTVALEQGYCSITYKKGLFDKMKDSEQLKCVEKIEAIVINK